MSNLLNYDGMSIKSKLIQIKKIFFCVILKKFETKILNTYRTANHLKIRELFPNCSIESKKNCGYWPRFE